MARTLSRLAQGARLPVGTSLAEESQQIGSQENQQNRSQTNSRASAHAIPGMAVISATATQKQNQNNNNYDCHQPSLSRRLESQFAYLVTNGEYAFWRQRPNTNSCMVHKSPLVFRCYSAIRRPSSFSFIRCHYCLLRLQDVSGHCGISDPDCCNVLDACEGTVRCRTGNGTHECRYLCTYFYLSFKVC